MKYQVPHGESFEINTIVLDLNGTLSVNGIINQETKDIIKQLRQSDFKIILFTGDQRGTAKDLCNDLNIDYRITNTGRDKEAEMLKLNTETCAAIGNARIDIPTLKLTKLAILTLQAEGIHAKAINEADIIVPSIADALNLFLNPNSLCATLRE